MFSSNHALFHRKVVYGNFLFIFLFLIFSPSALFSVDDIRFRYMGSSNIAMPTGYTRTVTEYISDDNHNMMSYSQNLLGKLFEVSALRRLNDPNKDSMVFSLKVNLLEEDKLLPNIVWGVSDFQTKLGSKIFYFAGSKNIDVFGVTIHGGFYKDPVTTDKKPFYGIEKTILPLVSIAGEHLDGNNSIGFKLRPYPNVSLEYATRNAGKKDEKSVYKAQYFVSF